MARFRSKEQCGYCCCPMKQISDNQIRIKINHQKSEFICVITSYQYGIFRIAFDLEDNSLKYKNKADIGTKLILKPFNEVTIAKSQITLTLLDEESSTESTSTYRLVINLTSFYFDYYLNDSLLMTFNANKSLALFNEDKLKSNSFDFTYINMPHCFGLPERPSHFFLKDDHYRLFNADDNNQHIGNSSPTYGSIPMLHGVNKDSIITVLNNNASDSWVQLQTEGKGYTNKAVQWITEGGIIDLYIHSDTDYNRNCRKIAQITGFAPMAPLFAFGYHHCRWGFSGDNELDQIASKFDEHNIPFDVIWLDIDHTDDKRYFTWDKKNFGNIKSFIQKLKDKNRILVTIIDPHMKIDPNYKIHKELKDNDLFVKAKNKDTNQLEPYIGHCWPGSSNWPDFINYNKILPLYKNYFKDEDYFLNSDNIHTWIDMNEPAVFDVLEYTMPKDNIHYDGNQIVQHGDVHNLYGYYYQKVAYNSLMNRYNDTKRPFVLSRSFYAGSQQYGWIWTGDNKATKDFMNCSIETNMTNALCGYSGCGSDVGGFIDDPTSDLLQQWYSLGCLYVFFRGHSCFNSIRREPWLFSKEICDSIKESITFKYNTLLFYYTKFFEHTRSGIPILQPLFMCFREYYAQVINLDPSSIFVLGNQLIGVNMFTVQDEGIEFLNGLLVPLYDIKTGIKVNKTIKKDEKIMVAKLAIGGSIIPWNEEVAVSSHFVARSPLSVKVFLDENMKAKGTLYFDGGIELDTEGFYVYLTFDFNNDRLKVMNINISNDIMSWKDKDIIPIWDAIEIYGLNKGIKRYMINNKTIDYNNNEENKDGGIKIKLRERGLKIHQTLTLNLM